MQTVTTDERTQVGAATLASFGKLEITDPDGSWVDVSTGLDTPDWLNSWQTSEGIDGNTMSFQASLLRDTGTLSLCPLREDSTINRNSADAYAPMLDVRRKWRTFTATLPQGSTPATGDWKETGSGYIDLIDPQEHPSEIRLTGRGMEAAILDAQIKYVRTYCSDAPVLVETVIQQLIDDTLGVGADDALGGLSVTGSSGITLYSPGYSPAFYINIGYRPATGNLMDAITKLAQLAGLVVRHRHDSSNVNTLTLYQPVRDATDPDWTIGPDEYLSIPLNSIDISGVRTVIDLYYIDASLGQQHVSSPAALTGTVACTSGSATFSTSQSGVLSNGDCILVGSALFKVSAFNGTTGCTLVAVSDGSSPTFSAASFTASDSITRYGVRYMRVDVAGTVTLDATQAQAMVDAMRSDIEVPALQQRFTTYAFWFAQLYDYGKMLANGVHYDNDQLGGVTAITQSYSGGVLRSTIDLGGQPKGRYRTWLRYASSSVDFKGPNLTVTPTPSATSYSIAWSGDSVTLSIDGADYATPSASPITVDRDGSEHTYSFSGLKNGQVTSDTVTISPLGAGVTTPDLTVTPGTQTSTTQPFTVTASNPATGGGTPTITVTIHGTTGTGSSVGSIAADTAKTVPSGEVVTVNRADFNTVPASATFKAALSGGGSEIIQRTISNQDKTAFGPNLTITVTPGATSYSIAWSGDTVKVSIDGGTAGTPASSPITVTRNAPGGADKIYAFTGLKDSQTVSNVVTIPAKSGSTPPSAKIFPNIVSDQLTPDQSPVHVLASLSNAPATYTYEIYKSPTRNNLSGSPIASGSESSNPIDGAGRTLTLTLVPKGTMWYMLVVTVGSDDYYADTAINPTLPGVDSDGTVTGLTRSVGTGSVSADYLAAAVGLNTANLVTNGNAEDGVLGGLVGWTYENGNAMKSYDVTKKLGSRSWLIDNAVTTDDSYAYQDVPVIAGRVYKLSAWILCTGLTGAGFGAALNAGGVATGQPAAGFTMLDKVGDDPSPTIPTVGIQATGGTGNDDSQWHFVHALWLNTVTTILRFRPQLGYGGNITGQAFFDDIAIQEVPPNTSQGGARGYNALDSNSRLVNQRTIPMVGVGGPRSQFFYAGTVTAATDPLTSSGTTITVPALDLYLGDSSGLSYSATTLTGFLGLANAPAMNYVYVSDALYTGTGAYYATKDPTDLVKNLGFAFVGAILVSQSGAGSGGYCVAPETVITMAGGREKQASDVRPGDLVHTRHETTREWGDFAVTHASTHEADRWALPLFGGETLIASKGHPVWMKGKGFTPIDQCHGAAFLDRGPVVQITVADAHTYVSNGVLSHNSKPLQ